MHGKDSTISQPVEQWVDRIPAFTDNYIWAIRNDRVSSTVVVDPGDPEPVNQYLKEHQLTLSGILITHHHRDHTGGLLRLKQQHSCTVYGPQNPAIEGIDHRLSEGDRVTLADLACEFSIVELPGHTLDHIGYIRSSDASPHPAWLFCGDTLFAGGCGRLFEGTPAQMSQSLSRLAALPGQTQVYCAHEYTQANLKFALAVEPNNQALIERAESVDKARAEAKATVPSDIETERKTNPFLRCNEDSVKYAAETFSGQSLSTEADVFAQVRRWKDQF